MWVLLEVPESMRVAVEKGYIQLPEAATLDVEGKLIFTSNIVLKSINDDADVAVDKSADFSFWVENLVISKKYCTFADYLDIKCAKV